MLRKLYILIPFLFMGVLVGYGQVEFKAKLSKDKIGMNERLRVDFEMNQNGDDFTPPDFKDFTLYAGPRQSISQSWVNGKQSFSKTYTYYLEPQKRGEFTIGQAKVTINGQEYKTSPLRVEVTASVDDPKDGDDEAIEDFTKDIHLITEVSNTNPYLNEGITVTYKLYVGQDANISNWYGSDVPKYSNFWNQDVKIDGGKVYHGSYRGDENYRYVYLKQVVLYPQKTGEITIEPLTITYTTEIPTSRRDFFGRQMYRSVEKKKSSGSRTITVKPLPEEGKPADFSGAVGNFEYKITAAKENLETEESVDVNIEVAGNGNLKLFSLPELEVPNSFEVYDPQRIEDVQVNAQRMQGAKIDKYTLVPNSSGKYTLRAPAFTYFDPEAGKYRTLSPKTVQIEVAQGARDRIAQAGDSENEPSSTSGPGKQKVTANKHFQYIKLKTQFHEIEAKPFFNSVLFWSLLLLPFVLLPILLLLGNKHMDRLQDESGNRLRRADRLARQYLSEAKKRLGDQQAYYEALENALHNYLKAKLALPTTEMSKAKIEEVLQSKQVEPETGKAFIELLKSCEFARYAPASEGGMQQDYDKAAQIIAAVDKQLKA